MCFLTLVDLFFLQYEICPFLCQFSCFTLKSRNIINYCLRYIRLSWHYLKSTSLDQMKTFQKESLVIEISCDVNLVEESAQNSLKFIEYNKNI